ncbi:ATP-binding cassette domain-containing protein [Fluviispira vulneris]|uniref:ATP-binding cassette domain-containing protein n=1 Tax=Fluviispira vulneris TaxID=2763012 RepID=UPI00256FF7D8|nr:ATP-binding cassette domain-containing protein [Fluviispira vulneris]
MQKGFTLFSSKLSIIKTFLYEYKGLLISTIGLQFVGRLSFLATIYISKILIDLVQINFKTIFILLLFGLVLFIATITGSYTKRCLIFIGSGISLYFYSLLNNVLLYHVVNRKEMESLVSQIRTLIASDIKHIQSFVNGLMSNFIPTLFAVSIFFPLLYTELGLAGLIAGCSTFLFLPLSLYISKRIGKYQHPIQTREESLNSHIDEWISNIREIRYEGTSVNYEERIASDLKSYLKISSKQHILVAVNFTFAMIWQLIPIIILFAIYSFSNQNRSIGSIFASIWMLAILNSSIQYIPFTLAAASRAKHCWFRITNQLSELAKEKRNKLKLTIPDFCAIQFESVSVKLGNTTLLSAFSAIIDLESNTFIEGNIGSGKSTLLRLLSGQIKHTSGTIFLISKSGARQEIASLADIPSYREMVFYVETIPFLTADSIVENIAFGSSYNRNKADEALRIAKLDNEFCDEEYVYREKLSENGKNISGGQRQRIGIAQAIYSSRPIILLDNCFSSLDQNTRNEILKQLHGNGLVLVYASCQNFSSDYFNHTITINSTRNMVASTHE